MSKNNNKRPSWYHPIARWKYDGAMTSYHEFVSRVLPSDESARYDIELPPSWRTQPLQWLLVGIGAKKLPEGSGAGFVQAPWADIYTRVYGVTPIADLPRYRTIYRNQPDIQGAIEKMVDMAIGRGFYIKHSDKKVATYLTEVADYIDLYQNMMVLAHDMLVYGNAYAEIQWADTVSQEEQTYDYYGAVLSTSEINALQKEGKEFKAEELKPSYVAQVVSGKPTKRCMGIKPLDPVYMRVRRDSWNNVYGFLQWITFPPVLLETDNMIHIKYRPKSWAYESAYGTSMLMPLIKNCDLLEQFENDSAIWVHSRAVPPLIVKGGGDPQHPYSTSQMAELLDKLKERTAASMIAVKSDVSIEELQGIARNLRLDWWLEYLLRRRYQALGIPPVLMGQPESANRAVGEVVFQDFITRIQLIQVFIGDAIETQLLYPLVKAKFGEEVEKPKIVWKPVVIEDRNMRSQRLVQALQAGAISINEFREEFGFETLDDDKYNDVKGVPTGPMGVPTGMPKVPSFAKPPPEGVPKKEEEAEVLTPDQEFRVKKMRLLVTQEQFKNELLDTVGWAKLELKQGDKTVKDIKKTALEKAKSTIDKYITDTYLYGKLDAVYTNLVKEGQTVKEDVLALTKEDLPAISKLKRKYNKDFKEIVEDMIKDREKGLL
jgi:hypothetical protein